MPVLGGVCSSHQNIHLVAKWLSTLEKKLEENSANSHPEFRVFISAEPAPSREGHIIPQGILENSIKITNEPPTGMHANLHKALDNFTQVWPWEGGKDSTSPHKERVQLGGRRACSWGWGGGPAGLWSNAQCGQNVFPLRLASPESSAHPALNSQIHPGNRVQGPSLAGGLGELVQVQT